MQGTIWRDQTGQVHGVVSDGGRTVATRHKGREITVDVDRERVRIRSTFPNGRASERLIEIPQL